MSTIELIKLAQAGDKSAGDRLITENSGLIWSIARRFFGRGVDSDDLYQLGSLGFVKAVMGFDTAYGTQFSTYAVPKILGEIRRFMRDDGIIKISRSTKDLSLKIYKARQEFEANNAREATISEISEIIGVSIEEIATCDTAMQSTDSLQRCIGEEGQTLEKSLGTAGIEDKIVESLSLKSALETLPDREKQVIILRFFKGLTQSKIATILNISQVQVSRIERKALAMLRDNITA